MSKRKVTGDIEVRGVFQDANMPAIRERVTLEQAPYTVDHMSKQFAGLRFIEVRYPGGEKDVFDPAGRFLFGLPAMNSRKE